MLFLQDGTYVHTGWFAKDALKAMPFTEIDPSCNPDLAPSDFSLNK